MSMDRVRACRSLYIEFRHLNSKARINRNTRVIIIIINYLYLGRITQEMLPSFGSFSETDWDTCSDFNSVINVVY